MLATKLAIILLLGILATTIAKPHGDASSSEEDGNHHEHKGGHHHHIPPFAVNATDEAKKELKGILKDKSLTKAQKDEKISAWAQAQGPEFSAGYSDFKAKIVQAKEELKKKLEESSLSPAVKDAVSQIDAIFEDGSLTDKETKDKIKAVFDGLSEEDRNAVRQFKKENFPRYARQAPEPENLAAVPFLAAASEEGRKKFVDIVSVKGLTKQQLYDQISAWAAAEGPAVKDLFDKEVEKLNKLRELIRGRIDGAEISDKSKDALRQVQAVIDDNNLTPEQEGERREQIMGSLSDDERKEVIGFMTNMLIVGVPKQE